MTLSQKADALAARAHEGQVRKDGQPYITHPRAVSRMLARYGFSEAVQAAALVHDVLEDTDVTPQELADELGAPILALVMPLTEDASLPFDERKSHYLEQVRAAPAEVKAICAADKIHNLGDFLGLCAQYPEKVWASFGYDKERKLRLERERLAMLRATWQHPLIDEYAALVGQLERLR